MHHWKFDPRGPRIQLAEQRLRDAYARRPGATVPIVSAGTVGPPVPACTERERLANFDTMLAFATAYAEGMGVNDSDWPPFVATYCGVAMVPEAFGCRVDFTPDGTAWAMPALTSMSQVWSLRPRPFREASLIRRLFEWIDFAQRRLGTAVPFWTMDLQSPFSVAAQIVEHEELLAGCHTDPAAVHHLCAMVTDFTIEYIQAHLAQMEHASFPGRNFPSVPDRVGLCVADDTPLIMLSPAMYREFAAPYLARLGAAFGPIHIHSCGNYRHNLDSLLALPCVASIQLHAGEGEFPLPVVATSDEPLNRARRRLTWFVDSSPVARGDAYRGRPREHCREYMLPRLAAGDLTGLILQACEGGADAREATAWTRAELARAQAATVGRLSAPATVI